MKYSLIIPHYNDTERLERLLRTVPVDREDVEVIVVDDCSPKQEALAAAKNRWPDVTWLATAKNSGAGAARNLGLAHAQGERLVFADSDDKFLPAAFDVFDKNVKDEDELVYFFADAVQEADSTPSNRAERLNELCRSYLESPTNKNLECLRLGHVTPWAKVYSRQFIMNKRVRFEETRVSNDVAFNVLASVQARNIGVVAIPVYCVHRRAKSLTADPRPEAFLERVNVVARLASALKDFGINERPSATGWMLMSFSYGLRTAFRTWRLCLLSDMRVDVFRIFQFARWKRFMSTNRLDRAEKNAAESSR